MPFTERKDELNNVVKAVLESVPADARYPEADSRQPRNLFQRFVDDYVTEREKCLGDLLRILEDDGQRQETWGNRAKAMRQRLADLLKAALDQMQAPRPKPVTDMLLVIVLQEDKFFDKLQDVPVVERRDQLIRLCAAFTTEIKQLENVWQDLLDKNKQFLSGEKEGLTSIQSLLNEAVTKVAEDSASIREKVSKKIEEAKKRADDARKEMGATGDVADVAIKAGLTALLGELGGIFAAGVGFLGAYLTLSTKRWEEHRQKIKERTEKQIDSVFYLFRNVRADVKSFLENNSLERAATIYREAAEALRGFASSSSASSSGQRKDADSFVEKALVRLDPLMRVANDAFRAFYEKNMGKFHGEVGAEVREAFLDSNWWQSISTDTLLQRDNLFDCLRRANAGLEGLLGSELDFLPLESKQLLLPELTRHVEAVNKAVEEASRVLAQLNEMAKRAEAEKKLGG